MGITTFRFLLKRIAFSSVLLVSLSALPTAYPLKSFGGVSGEQIRNFFDLKLPGYPSKIDQEAINAQMLVAQDSLNEAASELGLPAEYLDIPKSKSRPVVKVAILGDSILPFKEEGILSPHPEKIHITVPYTQKPPHESANIDEANAEEPIKNISRDNKPRHKIGVELYEQYEPFLEKLREQYGVDPAVVMGIWGIETNYGANFGRVPVRQALLSYARARPDRRNFVNGELAALNRLAAKGKINPNNMSSYAGAVGHTQFIPTSIEKFAVDGNGDNKIDLWVPKDALASTANYLAKHGWNKGQPWGYEVQTPAKIFSKPGAISRQPMSYWKEMGVRAKHEGTELPKTGHARLQRFKGRNYLLFDNFFVIMTYNHSTEYAYQVAALGDQVLFPDRAGVQEIALSINGPDTGGNWSGGGGGGAPKACNSKVCRVQKALKARGYYRGAIDGSMGPQLQKAIAKFQVANRLPPDGRITSTLTRKLF